MKEIKARPCPFCGWPVIEGVVDQKKRYRVQCRSCKSGTNWFKYWADAVDAWNKRVDPEEICNEAIDKASKIIKKAKKNYPDMSEKDLRLLGRIIAIYEDEKAEGGTDHDA